jgi:hypothetical protein
MSANASLVTEVTTTRPRVPLAESAALVAEIERRLADGEEPTDVINQSFHASMTDLAEGVDRRKAAAAALRSRALLVKAMAKDLTDHARRLEAAEERLREHTLSIMQGHPDVTFKDSAGRRLTVAKNSQATLVLSFESTLGKKTISNILDLKTIEDFKISAEFLAKPAFLVLDTAAVRAALDEGRELPWAMLTRGQHVRGL